MELKDAILSTLAEIDDITHAKKPEQFANSEAFEIKEKITLEPTLKQESIETQEQSVPNEDELAFLQNTREKLLVLFEGFQSPNNASLDAKLDLTLNFFEYLLAKIDNRLNTIKPKEIV
ncbi:MAG: hypothetical protein U9N42_02855 [Campylobacterota bacterium]|nr:hypothetical protein [Campylobacterota bacterium]